MYRILTTLTILLLGTVSAFAADRPNIVFILTDDQRYDTLGCTGNEFIQTPNNPKQRHEIFKHAQADTQTEVVGEGAASFLNSNTDKGDANEPPATLVVDGIREGKLVRQVQQETGRVVQVGTQQRSSFNKFNKALAIIADGRLGKLKRIVVGIDSGGWSPEIPVADIPDGFDWDAWLGPGPEMPFRYLQNPKKAPDKGYTNGHTPFRWWYEHSGGKLTDWGADHVDIAMLGIAASGQSNDPVSVDGAAKHNTEFKNGTPVQTDRYNTAMQFDLPVAFSGSDVDMNIRHDVDNGILFEGELGRIFVNRGKLAGKPVEDLAAKPLADDAISKVYGGGPMIGNDRDAHWANFLHAFEHRILPRSDV